MGELKNYVWIDHILLMTWIPCPNPPFFFASAKVKERVRRRTEREGNVGKNHRPNKHLFITLFNKRSMGIPFIIAFP
jgi:hypothetical protein